MPQAVAAAVRLEHLAVGVDVHGAIEIGDERAKPLDDARQERRRAIRA